MKSYQMLGFLISISTIMFFMGVFLKLQKNIAQYDKGEINKEELNLNKKGFIKSSVFSALLVAVGGTLVLIGI